MIKNKKKSKSKKKKKEKKKKRKKKYLGAEALGKHHLVLSAPT